MRAAATLLTACAIAWLGVESSAAVKVKTQFTKSFDFSKAKTWSWHDGAPGEVKMARTADDDPEVVRKRAEPVIMEAVAAALPKRGLTAAAAGAAADVQVKYYVLITIGTDAQVVGQFLPAVAAWGLPLFSCGDAVVHGHRARVARHRHQRQQGSRLARHRAGGAQAGSDPGEAGGARSRGRSGNPEEVSTQALTAVAAARVADQAAGALTLPSTKSRGAPAGLSLHAQ